MQFIMFFAFPCDRATINMIYNITLYKRHIYKSDKVVIIVIIYLISALSKTYFTSFNVLGPLIVSAMGLHTIVRWYIT